jgi:signal transduction histidine kinase
MKMLSSLKNRVFLASAFVAVLSIGLGTQLVTTRVSAEAEAELQRDLEGAAELLERHLASRTETLTAMAWLIADLPTLKAAVATGDPPTIEPLAHEYMERVGSDVIVITSASRHVLVSIGVDDAVLGDESAYFVTTDAGVLEMVTLPITVGPEPVETLGTLSVGFFLNDALAAELGALTQSEVVLRSEGRMVASTLGSGDADDEYVSVSLSLAPDGPEAELMRSRTARLSFLDTFRQGLVLSALVGVFVAILLSYAVARTVTRPLLAITETMQEITSTHDLDRKIELRGRWVDEDATVLARVFNRLTDSLARFQKEAASKERLSALGRMSTVIAHEVRNPLMIIKASLRSFRRAELADEIREAADDIDHEVVRLNRIVGDVLDFARPLQLELGPTDVNAVCREAAESIAIDGDALRLELDLDSEIPEIVTDGERLRTALVNILANARDAIIEKASNGEPDIELRTAMAGTNKVAISVRDHGDGIPPENLPKIFEPYFTGKRTGTGLGLAITKNIVESLGGTVTATSSRDRGTVIRVDLFLGS